MVEQGRLLSIAHSSRRTDRACELGINTLPTARRRGFARACVLAWAEAVAAEGLEPLYSANAANTASLALAAACGYRPIARAAQVPAVPASAPSLGRPEALPASAPPAASPGAVPAPSSPRPEAVSAPPTT